MKVYKEITEDRGCPKHASCSDAHPNFILTSAHAKDMYIDFLERYSRLPHSSWFRRHFDFRLVIV